MKIRKPAAILLLLAGVASAQEAAQALEEPAAQQEQQLEQPAQPESGFSAAASRIERDLAAAIAELDALRRQIQDQQVPLSRRLMELNAEYGTVQDEYQQVTRLLDSRNLDLSNLKNEIKARETEAGYLSTLFDDYLREFDSRLHVVEWQRYDDAVAAARLAPENSNLSEREIYERQAGILPTSLERIEELLGGARFQGKAIDNGLLEDGTFVLVGPNALFLPDGSDVAGTAEQRLDSSEPNVFYYATPENGIAAATLASTGTGMFPLDVTLGNAHKIAATDEPLWEHIKKGGAVMVPIFALAAAALIVALYKWLTMLFLRHPSKKQVEALYAAVGEQDEDSAIRISNELKGPVGQMLAKGVRHLREPREMIEEVMYETVLTTRLKLNSMLSFIAICAASAPLLGLLGTVTGIINTFKMITVYGSGDVKSLSGGISEALITTKFGLIVAIPSLLLHAFLSRKAKGVVNRMEKAAVALVNRVGFSRTHPVGAPPPGDGRTAPDPELVREQVKEVLAEIMGPLVAEGASESPPSVTGSFQKERAVRAS